VLFNATTLITLTIGALSFFAALFVLTLAAAGFLIDAGVLGKTIGRPAGAGEFVALALMTSVPGMEDYSPLWQFNYVVVGRDYEPNTLRSEADCLEGG
jgi:hypothetical protein